ncbi:hypothetical protein W04_1713 [Pseudoalteromonas sp. SW0106-04]|uniref:hypothetical protein n=1 Tax=Pseudoalteromonas sp. SW0106-04 TaxID=1702169 RepID=UPI0006C2CB0D|nr:hypothetical protein [Pseudoalteromonas sp. SW0106-04]GAP75193.1 hypothetical protein W04_1713 [Pseudoalteromonas sp. SW0106-04]
MPSWLGEFLILMNNGSAAFLVPAIVFFWLSKEGKALRFALLTAGFFLFGTLIHDMLLDHDTDKVWRYVVWASNDIIWMAIIAYWGIRGKVHMWQSIAGQLIVVAAPFLQLWRVADRHLWDLTFNSAYLYKTLLPIINSATLILCYLPILFWLQARRNKTAARTLS